MERARVETSLEVSQCCRRALLTHFTNKTRTTISGRDRGNWRRPWNEWSEWSWAWPAVAGASAVSGALVSKRTQFTCLLGDGGGGRGGRWLAQEAQALQCCEQRAPRPARGWRQRLQHRARPQVRGSDATKTPTPQIRPIGAISQLSCANGCPQRALCRPGGEGRLLKLDDELWTTTPTVQYYYLRGCRGWQLQMLHAPASYSGGSCAKSRFKFRPSPSMCVRLHPCRRHAATTTRPSRASSSHQHHPHLTTV